MVFWIKLNNIFISSIAFETSHEIFYFFKFDIVMRVRLTEQRVPNPVEYFDDADTFYICGFNFYLVCPLIVYFNKKEIWKCLLNFCNASI